MSNEPSGWERTRSIPAKIIENGDGWLWARLLRELSTPSTAMGRVLRPFSAAGLKYLVHPILRLWDFYVPSTAMDQHVYAFIDLDVCPVTFDVVDFVLLAALDCRRKSLGGVHVVFVPGRRDGFKEEEPVFAGIYDHHARRWRLQNICIQTLGLMPEVTGYTVCSTRAQASILQRKVKHISPAGYTTEMPLIPSRNELMKRGASGEPLLPFLKSPSQATRYLEKWLFEIAGNRKVICITLRDSKFLSERNSQIDAWIDFAKGLDHKKYQIVFIIDTDTAMDSHNSNLQGFPICREASWNIWLRAALYEKAWLSMGTLGGPSELCWYNGACRYLFFFSMENTSEERLNLMRKSGFEVGAPFFFAKPTQRIAWIEETIANINSEFEKISQLIAAEDTQT